MSGWPSSPTLRRVGPCSRERTRATATARVLLGMIFGVVLRVHLPMCGFARVLTHLLVRMQTCAVLSALLLALGATNARAGELPEYRLKAAFLYNFIVLTEWPLPVAPELKVCTIGGDPFGNELDALNGKPAGARSIAIARKALIEPFDECQVVFVAQASIAALPQVLKKLNGRPVLVVADSPGATLQGASLNMAVTNNRVTFEANVSNARAAALSLSSKLLRLATEVKQ